MENKYDKYKDSGIEWIGEIPEHWEVVDLKYLSDIRGRIGFRGYTASDLVSEGEGAFVIGGKHINQCVLNMESPDYISWEKYYESPEIMVSKGDLVMAQRGTLGKVAIIEYDINEATINPSLVLIKNIKCQGKFLYYYLYSESTLTLISILNTATAVPMISQNQIENMPIPIPLSIEQQSIATYLDQKCGEIDELITLQEEMITKLQSYKQSVITETVTKGLDKNAPLKDSGIEWIGEIPEHWKVVKIKYLAKIKSGDSISSNEVNQEGVYEVYGGNGLMGYCNKKNVDGFNIIIGRVGALCGNVRLISESKYITDNALILNCFDGVLCPYMYIMLKAANLNNLNTSNAQPLITGSKVLNVSLPIPPLPEQQSIADYLDQKCGEIDELISIKQQKIDRKKKSLLISKCQRKGVKEPKWHFG